MSNDIKGRKTTFDAVEQEKDIQNVREQKFVPIDFLVTWEEAERRKYAAKSPDFQK
jgi:hypothetical protein